MSKGSGDYKVPETMIEIIRTIDGGKREWSVEDIRERFDIDCDRTVRRYVNAMGTWFTDDEGNAKIWIEPRKDGLFVVASGALLANPLETDYVSVLFASKLLDFTADGVLKKGLQKLIDSIKSRAHGVDKNALVRMSRKFYVHHVGKQRAPADRELMSRILAGLVNEKRLAVRYHGWSEAKTVEPLCLKVMKEVLYLEVRYPGKEKTYTLTVPLIKEARLLDEKFTFPEDWHPEQDNKPRFGLMPGEIIDVELYCVPKLETYLRSREFHPTQFVDKLADGTVRLSMRTTDSDELVSWISGFGGLMKVAAPKKLRERVKRHLSDGLAQYA